MSGWRAGLVAVALGAVVLAVGWFLNRPDPTDPTSPTDPVVADFALACPSSFTLVCDELASRHGLDRVDFTAETPIPEGGVVIGFAADLPAEATVFARSPIAIGVWSEKAPALEATCGTIDPSCVVAQAGKPWAEIGGSPAWGTVRLGLADPATGMADLESWRLIAAENPGNGLRASVPLHPEDEGDLLEEMVLFPSRVDIVVGSEVAIGSQLANARARAGRIDVFYPDPTPYLPVAAIGDGRAARSFVEMLVSPEIQALLGSLGLRPLNGEVQNLMQDLGQPGAEAPLVTDAEIDQLQASWDAVIGS